MTSMSFQSVFKCNRSTINKISGFTKYLCFSLALLLELFWSSHCVVGISQLMVLTDLTFFRFVLSCKSVMSSEVVMKEMLSI